MLCVSPAWATMPPLSGEVPETLTRAFEDGLFELPAPTGGLGIRSTQTTWRVPAILVGFADAPLRYAGADFERALFDTTRSTPTGSVFDYYQWASRGRLTVIGDVVATVQLPRDRHYYAWTSYGLSALSTPNNDYGLVYDALTATQAGVNWSDYDLDHDGYVDMLWVIHSGVGGETTRDRDTFWSITSRMTTGWRAGTYFTTSDLIPGSNTLHIRIDRFTIVPELSALSPGGIAEIGTYCHEFGHALGLPDLYDTANPSNSGPGNWSLMSSGAYGGDGLSPQLPSHPGAWAVQFLGWDQTLHPARDSTVDLTPVARDGSVLEWWFEGEPNSEHFLVENRCREGFDRSLLGEGLLVYHVDEAVIGQRLRSNSVNSGPTPGLMLVEADGDNDLYMGRNRGDPQDPFPGELGRNRIDDDTQPSARTFGGAITNLALRDIAPVGDVMRFTAQVRSPGWLPPEDHSGAAFQPVDSYGSGRVAGTDDRGEGYLVGVEMRAGHPQVTLRGSATRWSEAFQVSSSSGAARDPALAVLSGGDLAIVWSDTRDARAKLYYRSRIQGTWTDERPLVSLSGECLSPAIDADANGTIYLAFRQVEADAAQVRFMRFSYFWPFGQSTPVTRASDSPGSPAIAAGPGGVAYVLWVDWTGSPQRLLFSRFAPDSGLSAPQTLTPPPYLPQLAVSAVVDPAGTLHSVWQMSGAGGSQLRYQRRPVSGTLSPADTLLEIQGGPLLNPMLSLDSGGGLHLAFEAPRSGLMQVRYKRWQAGKGWDYRSTEVTSPEDGLSSRPQLLPGQGGNLSVVYFQYPAEGAHLMVRERHLWDVPVLASPPPAPAPGLRLGLGPNPLRAGEALELSWSGGGSGTPVVEVFDLAGRRLASVLLDHRDSNRWRGRLAGVTTGGWAGGVYLARMKGSAAPGIRVAVLR